MYALMEDVRRAENCLILSHEVVTTVTVTVAIDKR